MDLMDHIYSNRNDFMVIGLTGRTGCGCTTVADILCSENPTFSLNHKQNSNELLKDAIILDISKKWKKFFYIRLSDIITSFLLENSYTDLEHYIKTNFSNEFNRIQGGISKEQLLRSFNRLHLVFKDFAEDLEPEKQYSKSGAVFKRIRLLQLCSSMIHKFLNRGGEDFFAKLYQLFGDNIRLYGKAIPGDTKQNPYNIYKLIERVNCVIKCIKRLKKENSGEYKYRRFVLDAIRNPLEAVYFKERYSAFYLIGVNCSKYDRIDRLTQLKKMDLKAIELLDNKEAGKVAKDNKKKEFEKYKTNKNGIPEIVKIEMELHEIISQNIPACLEKADIHLFNGGDSKNNDKNEVTRQILRYISLITHPGIITPTKNERMMQIAYTAKENSNCISRRVGAVIVSGNDKIEGIGWNDVPQGQTGCLLRNVNDLMACANKFSYSKFELEDKPFRDAIISKYAKSMYTENTGLPLAFCFKSFKNSVDKEKNQVHTRALHAEENAFLQSVKKGGVSVEGGVLYSTASPCELCAKKAYQLSISKVVYIDPYPGISEDHIFNSGEEERRPKLVPFYGAIGQAYFKLYSQILPYKDEIDSRILDYNNYLSNNLTEIDICLENNSQNRLITKKVNTKTTDSTIKITKMLSKKSTTLRNDKFPK